MLVLDNAVVARNFEFYAVAFCFDTLAQLLLREFRAVEVAVDKRIVFAKFLGLGGYTEFLEQIRPALFGVPFRLRGGIEILKIDRHIQFVFVA